MTIIQDLTTIKEIATRLEEFLTGVDANEQGKSGRLALASATGQVRQLRVSLGHVEATLNQYVPLRQAQDTTLPAPHQGARRKVGPEETK